MGFLDPKPQTTAGLDAAVTAKINDGASATKAALNATYAPIANPTFTGTVGGVTKSMVGLGSVDNTADTAKPVSTAQQTALNLKAPLASPAFTGTPTGITKTHVGLGNVDNTADTAKPVSTAQQTALDGKVGLANDETITGGKTFSSLNGLRTTTWMGIGAGVGSARNPFYLNQIVDGANISNTLAAGGGDDYVGVQHNIKFQGGFAALKTTVTGSITAGTNTLALTSGTFTSPIAVGFTVYIPGAGVGGGLPLKTKITSITDSTHAVLAANASTTVTAVSIICTLASDHNFLFAANDFYTTGTASGDLSGIDNLFGKLTELHLYTPGATISTMKAGSFELDIEASATGATVTTASVLEISQARNDAGATVTNSYGLMIHGVMAGSANSYGLYVDGGAKTKLTGPTTLAGTAAGDVPAIIQLPLGATGEALQMWDYTFVNKRFHVANTGAVGSSNFITAFEGLGASTAIGSMTGGFAGIRMGSSGVEIVQSATGVAAVRGAGKAFQLPAVTTANRVSAANAGAGGLYYDTTLNVWGGSDGTTWKNIVTGATI